MSILLDKIMSVLLNKINNEMDVSINKIVAFLTSMIIGFLAHGLIMFNIVYNCDCLWGKFGYCFHVSLGRFVGSIIEKIMNHIDPIVNVQTFNIFICILLLSISTMLIIEILKIKNLILTIIISSVFMMQPTVINSLGCWFTSHIYYMAMCIYIYSAHLILDKKKIIIPAIINILVMGIYQSYLPLVMSIGLIKFIRDILDNKDSKIVFKEALRFLLIQFISTLLYIILAKISLIVFNDTIWNHAGIGSNIIENGGIVDYLNKFLMTYNNFIDFLFNGYGYYSRFNIMRLILVVIVMISIFLEILLFFKIKKNSKVLYVIFILLLIPTFDLSYIMTTVSLYVERLQTGNIFFLLMPLLLIDKVDFKMVINKINIIEVINKKIIPIVYSLVIVFMLYICMGNHQALIDNNKDCYNTINYMCNMIINNPEYDNKTNIILIGNIDNYHNFSSVNSLNKFTLHDNLPLNNMFHDTLYKIAFSQFGSMKIDNKVASSEVKEYLEGMENFPSNKCMKKIDEYNLIFKLSD